MYFLSQYPTFTGIHLGWSNINTHVTIEEDFTVLYLMSMLLFDAILYMAIALYIDAVFPGKFGIPKRWDFPIRVRSPRLSGTREPTKLV